jgi:hypothetical protein
MRKEYIKRGWINSVQRIKGTFTHYELSVKIFYEMEIRIHISAEKHLRFE